MSDQTSLLELAEKGDAAAQNILAARLATGDGAPLNLQAAVYWYARAAAQGYTHAKFNLGTLLIEGEGLANRYVATGVALIADAAHHGDPSACRFLSFCYEQGAYGLEKNIDLAQRWERMFAFNSFVEFGEPFDVEQVLGIALNRS